MGSHFSRHFRMLELAKQAFDLGARCHVVKVITGLPRCELAKVFRGMPNLSANHGGMPRSPDWFVNDQNYVIKVHVAHFYAYFHHQYRRAIPPNEALIASYRRYVARYAHDPRLDFDRAYVLVSCVHGLWSRAEPTLEAARCADCGALHIGAVGLAMMRHHDCPFCKVSRDFERQIRMSAPLTHPVLRRLNSLTALNDTCRLPCATPPGAAPAPSAQAGRALSQK